MTEKQKVAHLLRRFGLGASEAEVEFYAQGGLKSAIDKLLNYNSTAEPLSIDPMEFANAQRVVNIRVMQGLWYLQMLATPRPLEEKMTLFWHNHFAISAEKVDSAFAMMNSIGTLRQHAVGNFRDMLVAISKDPAMLFWLDNQLNTKESPNENFAREIMELFTLGIGHYSEKDVQEASRAFTGWRYGVARRVNPLIHQNTPRRIDQFVFVKAQHDEGEKTVLGKTGNFNGEDIIDMLCEHPQTARYITKKMFDWFVYENAEKDIIEKHAQVFIKSGLSIASLIRSIMESDEFYSEKAVRKLVKSPIDFAVAIGRQFGHGPSAMALVKQGIEEPVVNDQNGVNNALVRALAGSFATRASTTSMGMELFYPPDVSGWRTGAYWVTSATMVERIKFADYLFAGTNAATGRAQNLGANQPGNRTPQFFINAWNIVQSDPTPKGVVDKVASVLDAELPETKKAMLLQTAQSVSGGTINIRNAGEVCRQVCRVLFGAPEFQFG